MLIAIDPGGTTGMAFRFENQEWGTLAVPLSHQLEVTEKIASYARSVGSSLTVAVEQFSTMQYLSKDGINTIELVGGIVHVCALYNIVCFRHAPMHRTPFQANAHEMLVERRNKLGRKIASFVVHEEDALAHLLRLEYNLKPPVRLRGHVNANS